MEYFLATAFTGFIFSITMTTAAVTLFMLAAMPFIAAIVGYFILGETLRRTTLFAMIVAFLGVCVMIFNDSISGSALGAIIGFISATGFALYSVTIRWKPETPKFTTVVLAGLFCALFSFCILGLSFEPFEKMPRINSYLSLLHGLIVALGLILIYIRCQIFTFCRINIIIFNGSSWRCFMGMDADFWHK